MICAVTLFLMAHQWHKPLCAVVIGALVKNNGVSIAPLCFLQRRANGAMAQNWASPQPKGPLMQDRGHCILSGVDHELTA
jgi:hypothetical protein